MAPSHTSCFSNRGAVPDGASSAQRCSAKWAVRATVAPASTAWNCARVLSRCMEADRKAPSGCDGDCDRTANGAGVPLDGEALAALGAACVDDGTAATGLHADEEAVGTGAADFGCLVSAFHDGFPDSPA